MVAGAMVVADPIVVAGVMVVGGAIVVTAAMVVAGAACVVAAAAWSSSSPQAVNATQADANKIAPMYRARILNSLVCSGARGT
jgi:hypothetical protein